jgi:hypothetical protein
VLVSWGLAPSEPTYRSGAWAESHTEIGIMSSASPNPYLPHRCISPCILISERQICFKFLPQHKIKQPQIINFKNHRTGQEKIHVFWIVIMCNMVERCQPFQGNQTSCFVSNKLHSIIYHMIIFWLPTT